MRLPWRSRDRLRTERLTNVWKDAVRQKEKGGAGKRNTALLVSGDGDREKEGKAGKAVETRKETVLVTAGPHPRTQPSADTGRGRARGPIGPTAVQSSCVLARVYTMHRHAHTSRTHMHTHGYLCPRMHVYTPTCGCTSVHRGAGTHAHTDLTEAPPSTSRLLLAGCGIRIFHLLQRPPLIPQTQTRGAGHLWQDSGFRRRACVPAGWTGAPASPRVSPTRHSVHSARSTSSLGCDFTSPANTGPRALHGSHWDCSHNQLPRPKPRSPQTHLTPDDLSPFHLFSHVGFSGPKPLLNLEPVFTS